MQNLTMLIMAAFLMVSCAHHGKTYNKDHHTNWAAKKLAKRQAKFQKMDKNGDGKVTKKEWKKHLKSKFKKIDANNDKSLTAEEFMSYYKSKCKLGGKKSCCSKGLKKNKKCSGKSCPSKKRASSGN